MAYPLAVMIGPPGVDGRRGAQAGRRFISASFCRSALLNRANSALKAAASSWFVVVGIGQLMFVAYLFDFYGRTTILGQFEAWNQVFPSRLGHSLLRGERNLDTLIWSPLVLDGEPQCVSAGQ